MFNTTFRSLYALLIASTFLAIAGCDGESKKNGASRPHWHYGSYSSSSSLVGEEDDEYREARRAYQDAVDELRSSVDALAYTRWRDQMWEIRSRLDDAEDALGDLERVRPNAAYTVRNRSELDMLRMQVERLQFENWRHVVPGVRSGLMDLEDEADDD
jgi:hypothetical protein